MKNIYLAALDLGLRKVGEILNKIPADFTPTHYQNGSYLEEWSNGKWVKVVDDQLEDIPKPNGENLFNLVELRAAYEDLKIIDALGGVSLAEEDIKMAKIMRTMIINNYHLHDVERAVLNYKTNTAPASDITG